MQRFSLYFQCVDCFADQDRTFNEKVQIMVEQVKSLLLCLLQDVNSPPPHDLHELQIITLAVEKQLRDQGLPNNTTNNSENLPSGTQSGGHPVVDQPQQTQTAVPQMFSPVYGYPQNLLPMMYYPDQYVGGYNQNYRGGGFQYGYRRNNPYNYRSRYNNSYF